MLSKEGAKNLFLFHVCTNSTTADTQSGDKGMTSQVGIVDVNNGGPK